MYLYNTQKIRQIFLADFFVFVMKIFRLKFALLMKIFVIFAKSIFVWKRILYVI